MAPATAPQTPPDGFEGEGAAPAEGFDDDDDLENSVSLSAMEAELKPRVLETFDRIADAYKKLRRLQDQNVENKLKNETLSPAQERKYKALKKDIVADVKSLSLNQNRIDALVEQLYDINKRLIGLDVRLMRLAEAHRVSREDFLKNYQNSELDPKWLLRVSKLGDARLEGVRRERQDRDQGDPQRDPVARDRDRPRDPGIPQARPDGAEGRARGAAGEEGDGRGEPAPRHLDRQEIHQPRPAVPRPDPGRQHRPDEGGRQVRVPPRLQVLDLRDLVDPAGDHPHIADQARTIRIPVHMIETINKIVRTSRQMLHEIGREPTPEELAEKLAMPLEKVRKVLKIAKEPISLETPIGDEEDSHLGDFIEDKNAVLPIDAAIQSNLRETTTRVLGVADAARGARAAHALRHRHEHRPHARRGRPAVLGDPRAHPPDRGQGAAQAEASVALQKTPKFSGQLRQSRLRREATPSGLSCCWGADRVPLKCPHRAARRGYRDTRQSQAVQYGLKPGRVTIAASLPMMSRLGH